MSEVVATSHSVSKECCVRGKLQLRSVINCVRFKTHQPTQNKEIKSFKEIITIVKKHYLLKNHLNAYEIASP